jgi:hypothetical protein
LPHKTDILALLNRKLDSTSARKVNWRGVLKIAERSHVLPLLYYSIEDRQRELGVPEDIFLKLKNAYDANSARNMTVIEEFAILSRSLKEAGVPITLLKGSALIHTIFQDSVVIRKMDDIDILVKEEDLRKAARVLQANGYKLPHPFDLFNATGGVIKHKSVMYNKHGANSQQAPAPVHLHWHVVNISSPMLTLNWSKINMSEIWNSITSIGVDGSGNMFVMCPEHMVLALCEHGMRNGFAKLNILYDIHSYVTRYRHSIDWHKLSVIAKAWGLTVPLHVGLLLSQMSFETYIPTGFFTELRPKGMSVLEKHFINYVHTHDEPSHGLAFILYLAAHAKFKDKVKFLARAIGLGRSR